MQREGYKNSTIKSAIKTLKAVANRCNITNPIELKTHLATANYTQNRKHKIICDIARLYRQLGIQWERPRSGPNGGNHRQPYYWLGSFATVKFMSYVIADDLQWFT